MEVKAIVQFMGVQAHYHVLPQSNGIFHAILVEYDGGDVVTPPKDVVLVRSARQWVGSFEEQDFIDELGAAIDHQIMLDQPEKQ